MQSFVVIHNFAAHWVRRLFFGGIGGGLYIFWFFWRKELKAEFQRRPIVGGLAYLGVTAIGSFIYGLFLSIACQLFALALLSLCALAETFGFGDAAAVAPLLVLCVGFIAFLGKKVSQWWYGITEIVFAAGSAIAIGSRVATGKGLFSMVLALIGCAYVVARGVGNVVDGAEDRQEAKRQKLIDRLVR